ncbi:TPA: hypothetical protein I9749_001810 [Serratia marcescens]|nr:hypothetical protein [Serratia marcescens]
MDNKLSELSKPVAYDYQIASACIADGHNKNGKWVDWGNRLAHECPPDWMVEDGKVTELKPLYSQEYISALLAELEAKTDFSDKAIERISGLEKACDKYLRQTKKAERELLSAKERIAELEAKLATPVRLPEPCVYEVNGTRFYDRLSEAEVIASLREQGFTVEGA